MTDECAGEKPVLSTDKYIEEFTECLNGIEVVEIRGHRLNFQAGVEKAVRLALGVKKQGGTLAFIGNGGSAAIAGHQATDFLKNCGIRTYVPLDPSLLTCMANDFSYSEVFTEPLSVMLQTGDVLVAISSSGRSKNILYAATRAAEKGVSVITLSGFKGNNPLRRIGRLNFYVSSDSYRIVESAHLFICNCILDFTIRSLEEKEN